MIQKTEAQIMQNWKGDISSPVVSICSITYNHEEFISETLDSLLMQETDFPFEIVVDDDCSPDKTANIIKEYILKFPNIFNAQLRDKNVGMSINYRENLQRARGRYLAPCEGDDYWIDPLKLKKQVEFLEKNLDYGLVHTDRLIYNQKNKTFSDSKIPLSNQLSYYNSEVTQDYKYEEIINWGCNILTLTTCFRKKLIMDLPKLDSSEYFSGDRLLYIHIALQSKIKYFKDKTAVYRVLENSASAFTDPVKALEFRYKHSNLVFYFLKNYPVNTKLHEIVFYKNMFMRFQFALASGDYNIFKTVKLTLPPNPSIKMRALKILYFLCKCKFCFNMLSSIYKRRIYAPYKNKNLGVS